LRRGSRHRARGLEILMMRRGPDARFMPGVWVFPGGAVDPEDREAAARQAPGSDPELDADELAHRICGAREVGEESAVEIDAADLHPWSRWVTPEVVPIRFDTRFYVALAPPHSAPTPDEAEVDMARWIGPAHALAEHADGELELSFPTIKHLEELSEFPDADAVIADGRSRRVEAITPRVRGEAGNFEVLLPGDPGFAD
jgi:8-oxo-dGTP pyrophosphatase MutT (NUDIX family)